MPDVLAFYETFYSPNNATLVVAGDVDPEEVMRLAEETYGAIPAEPGLPERVRPQEPPQIAERRVLFDDPRVSQPYVLRSYVVPERDRGDQGAAAALAVLGEVLGGSSFTSVLARDLTFEADVALFTGAGYDGTSVDDATFSLSVVPRPGVTLAEAEAALDASLDRFLRDGVDPGQLDRIKAQLRASEVYALDSVEGLANRYGAALSVGLEVADVEAWPGLLQAVTAEDLLEAARRLDRDASVTMWVAASREGLQ